VCSAQIRQTVTGCDHEGERAVAGIGAAIVRRFLDAGARVVIADLDEAAARKAAEALGERAVAMHCDVTCALLLGWCQWPEKKRLAHGFACAPATADEVISLPGPHN